MADSFSAIAEGIGALFELAGRVLVAAFTFVAYACSGVYRRRKNAEWKGRPARKALTLGFSGLCLAGLIFLGVWAFLTVVGGKSAETARRNSGTNRTTAFRFSMQITDADGTNRSLQVALDNEGVRKLVAAGDLNDLAERVKESVNVAGVRTNAATNGLLKIEFHVTNQ